MSFGAVLTVPGGSAEPGLLGHIGCGHGEQELLPLLGLQLILGWQYTWVGLTDAEGRSVGCLKGQFPPQICSTLPGPALQCPPVF